MSKPIEVGCIVEVVEVHRFPDWRGRHLVVTRFGRLYSWDRGAEDAREVITAPMPPAPNGWHPCQLCRIDPPDWEAPRIEQEELQA